MEKCPNCNNELDKKYNFCPSCGYDLRESEIESDSSSAAGGQDVVVCDVCGEDTLVESGVCEYCGARLSGKEKKIVNSKTAEKLAKSANAEIPKKPAFEKTKPDVVKKHSSGPGKKRIEVKKIKPVVPGVKSDSKNLTSGQLGIIIVGLIAIAGIILYISGVFGSGPKPEIPNTTNSAIKMDDMQRINELETTVNSDTTKKELVLELAHRLNDSGLKEKAIKYYLMYLKS
ncbi:MAG: zinc ribbon domain-containing protein, partial [Methanococcaceae archaeon]